MSLRAFEIAVADEKHLYELARGVVVVSEVPDYEHACTVTALRDPLIAYKTANPGRIHQVLGSMECKLLITAWASERHPDLAIYLQPPRRRKGRSVWRTWLPDLVIEVVSPGSVDRDYVAKREEYWTLGIKEYWIVDAGKAKVLLLRRGRHDWLVKELHADDACETKLLPGFKLRCAAIFAAAQDSQSAE
jgi:Uma2 family endonuclease